jgi:hypothetical protein
MRLGRISSTMELRSLSRLRAGLSHLGKEREEIVLDPSGTFDFASDGGLKSIAPQEIEGEAPKQGEVLGGIVLSGARAIFVEDDIEDPMLAVLDTPMGTHSGENVGGGERSGEDKVTALAFFDITEPADGVDPRDGRQILELEPLVPSLRDSQYGGLPGLDAAMVVLWPIDCVGRDVVQQRDSLVIEWPAVAFERQNIVTVALADRFCHLTIAMKRIRRNGGVFQIKHCHQFKSSFGLAATRGPALPQNQPVLGPPGGDKMQWRRSRSSLEGARQRLAVDGDDLTSRSNNTAKPGSKCRHELTERGLEGDWIEQSKDSAERVVAGYPMAKPQKLTKRRFFRLAKIRHVLATFRSAKHGGKANKQHLAKVVPRIGCARIGDTGKKRTEIHRRLPANIRSPLKNPSLLDSPLSKSSNAIPLRLRGR